MIVAKIAVWYDPAWWGHRATKGNWKRKAYWVQATVQAKTGQARSPVPSSKWSLWARLVRHVDMLIPRPTGAYTLGPIRLDVRLTNG